MNKLDKNILVSLLIVFSVVVVFSNAAAIIRFVTVFGGIIFLYNGFYIPFSIVMLVFGIHYPKMFFSIIGLLALAFFTVAL